MRLINYYYYVWIIQEGKAFPSLALRCSLPLLRAQTPPATPAKKLSVTGKSREGSTPEVVQKKYKIKSVLQETDEYNSKVKKLRQTSVEAVKETRYSDGGQKFTVEYRFEEFFDWAKKEQIRLNRYE